MGTTPLSSVPVQTHSLSIYFPDTYVYTYTYLHLHPFFLLLCSVKLQRKLLRLTLDKKEAN